MTSRLYRCSRIIIPCRRLGALNSGFFRMLSSGLWSDCTVTLWPKVYWSNFSAAKTIAGISFSICAYLVSVSVSPLDGSARTRRLNLWSSHLQTTPHKLSFSPKESLPPGSSEAWPTWSSLNRLRTGTGRCKSLMQKWGFNEDGQTACECGDEQTMTHLLVCPILPQPCTHEDLEEFNHRARSCA